MCNIFAIWTIRWAILTILIFTNWDFLCVTFFFKTDFYTFGSCFFIFGRVFIDTDFILKEANFLWMFRGSLICLEVSTEYTKKCVKKIKEQNRFVRRKANFLHNFKSVTRTWIETLSPYLWLVTYTTLHTEGQLILEWLFGVFKKTQKFHEFFLDSKKWSNQKDKGILLC